MWANAQRDGRPAEYRWRPLFNAAKFGRRPLLECRAVTLPSRNKNSSGDEIANVNFFTTSHMYRPAPTPIERVRNFY